VGGLAIVLASGSVLSAAKGGSNAQLCTQIKLVMRTDNVWSFTSTLPVDLQIKTKRRDALAQKLFETQKRAVRNEQRSLKNSPFNLFT